MRYSAAEMSEKIVQLPSGKTLDLARPRSDGVLTHEELEYCRANAVPMAYDPAQIGWVILGCEDDVRNPFAPVDSVRITDLPSRFRFRKWVPDDLAEYMRILGNPRVWELLPEPFPEPFDDEVAAGMLELSRLGSHHEVRAVEHRGRVVGQVRLIFDARARRAEIPRQERPALRRHRSRRRVADEGRRR